VLGFPARYCRLVAGQGRLHVGRETVIPGGDFSDKLAREIRVFEDGSRNGSSEDRFDR